MDPNVHTEWEDLKEAFNKVNHIRIKDHQSISRYEFCLYLFEGEEVVG